MDVLLRDHLRNPTLETGFQDQWFRGTRMNIVQPISANLGRLWILLLPSEVFLTLQSPRQFEADT
jgi:hypothetical protein